MDEGKPVFQPIYSQVEKALRKYIGDSDLNPASHCALRNNYKASLASVKTPSDALLIV